MSDRKAFLEAACGDNVEEFLRFTRLHKDKMDPFDLNEVVQELSSGQRLAMWKKLASLLHDVLLMCPPEQWEAGPTEEDKQETMEEETPHAREHTMSVVGAVTLVATVSLNVLQDGDTYTALLKCADLLHDVLASLPVSEAPLQQAIHRLFETWWKKGLMGNEKFGQAAFLVSLQKSFILKKPGAEITRLWGLREVLLGLDFTAEDNKDVVNLLLQCFLSINYIKNDDGKRFMVFLFSWNVDFIRMIHGTIKNLLEFSSKALTQQIAEIYFRAWKKASGLFQEEIESTCIQDLMSHAILLYRTSPVHSKIRTILSYLHKRKNSERVEKMLYTLYKPILWRALLAANSEVRANATLLFTEAFPIHNPSDNSETINQTIQKQLDTLMRLLEDVNPVVRSMATLGVCRVLARCWELIPPTVITDFLKKLILELAADTSSPDTRCSVFKFLPIVLDNSESHTLMAKLLPPMKNSLHDTSEKVRVAFLDMLLKVKAVRATKFWEVCKMEHLLARLAIDSQPVSKRIVNLLFTSFFPADQSEREWCCRAITLIQMNPAAARKFYQYAPIYTTPANIVKLMLSIRHVLNMCLKSQIELTSMNESNKENGSASESDSQDVDRILKDPGLMASLIEVVVILWKNIKVTLEKDKEAHKYTVCKFGSVLPKYFNTFEDERCTAPLIRLASLLPPTALPTYSGKILSKLRKMEPGANEGQYNQLIDCLCGWGQAGDIIELITDWLSTEALLKPQAKPDTKRRIRIQETVEAKPDLGLDFLEYLLSHQSTRDRALQLSQLKQLHKSMEAWRSVLSAHLKSDKVSSSGPNVEVALRALGLQCRLSAHLHHTASEGRGFLLALEDVAEWAADSVLPFLASPAVGDEVEAEKRLTLARRIVESFLTVCQDVVCVGLADAEFKGQILRLCSLVALTEKGYLCAPLLISYLKEVAEGYVPGDAPAQREQGDEGDENTAVLRIVANIFQKVVEILARRLKKNPKEGKEVCLLTIPSLTEFLKVVQSWDNVSSNPLDGVFSTLFAGIIVECQHKLQKTSHPEEVMVPETVDDMPPLSSVLLTAVLKLLPTTSTFLAELTSSLDSKAIDSLEGLVAIVHILSIIKHTGQLKADVEEAAAILHRQLQSLGAPTATDEDDIQRVIFESGMETLNHILNPVDL